MEDLKSMIKDVLERGELMSLGTVDEGGVWVCDIVTVSDEFLRLYWISHKNSRHSLAIVRNPEVAATVSLHGEPIGVQIKGTVEAIQADSILIREIHAKQGRADDTDIKDGEAMYCLTPKVIEVINLLKFGFQKKTFTSPVQ